VRRFLFWLDRVGSVGALVAAVAAPCCLPIFATLASAIGIAAIGLDEGVVLYLLQGCALLSLVGVAFAFTRHRHIGPLLLALISVCGLLICLHFSFSVFVIYGALAGLCLASIWNYVLLRKGRMCAPILQSVITCPQCGHRAEETMPTNACLFFYDCLGCGVRLKRAPCDCCVFCSYGSVPCPPIQTGAPCCA
jgi:hypothetical protein